MSAETEVYAHTLPNQPQERWELLADHADRVETLARENAGAFGAGEWGELLGRWHDLGKGSAAFQSYIRATADPDSGEADSAPGKVDHSTFGAQYAAKTIGGHFGQLFAFCIAGHHAGLADAFSADESTQSSTLHARLKKVVPVVKVAPAQPAPPKPKLPFSASRQNAGFQIAFFTRMLFSALVDADRTATEKFCAPPLAALREQQRPTLSDMQGGLDSFLSSLQSGASPSVVNQMRSSVLADCRRATSAPRGFFSLNVPTGGGKTYASLAFAFEHARVNGLRRVIVAIPFTSIIEQTADLYRDALGEHARLGLIEHHSNIDPRKHTRQNQMAAENWDAPLIVTTNVQLYESLFAASTTPCRKLHRIANSVIVLDEAQTIPIELIEPTLMALRELVAHYQCSVVLCTATQPALERRASEFEIGLENVHPIITDVPALFIALRRVEVTRLGKITDEQLIDRLANESSVLCVVNTRPHASKLYDALVARCGSEGCYHLSTFMCAQHRRDKLAEIRQRLKEGKPCRLISTQLIEAGVDVDFPAVYRAPAGFDSVAQAAGRCNREGRLDGLGRVYVFETETPPPPGLQRAAAQCGRELISRFADPIAPDAVEAYFRLFYWSQKHQWDKHQVLPALADEFRRPEIQLKFRTAAANYRIIRDEQTSILVPYDRRARKIRDQLLRTGEVDFAILRKAQRYLVGVRDNMLNALRDNGVIIEHDSGLWIMVNEAAYSPEKGMSLEAIGIDSEILIQ